MIEILTSPQAWISLATLTGLEIILGIDNIIFIAILCSRLPHEKQRMARLGGLALAMVTRILLLFSIFWVMKLTKPFWQRYHFDFGRTFFNSKIYDRNSLRR